MRERLPPALFINMTMMMMAMMIQGPKSTRGVSRAGCGTPLSVTPRPCAIRAMSRVVPSSSPPP
jgi:hypothetical protein